MTALSKSCYYHTREVCCIHSYLDFKIASTIATSIAHSKLDYCNSLYHNLPHCQLNRLQQIQNSLARAVVKAPKSTHITPILKYLHWLKVNECIEYNLPSVLPTKFVQPLSLSIFTTLSLFNLLAVPAPHLLSLSLSLARQPNPPWKSQIAYLDMHHLVFGINFPIHSVSLTILVLIHLLTHLSSHLSHHPCSHYLLLLHSVTPGSKPTFSTNPSHLRLLLPTGLPSR